MADTESLRDWLVATIAAIDAMDNPDTPLRNATPSPQENHED